MNVIVYSTTTCPYCKMLKNYFEEKKIAFTEKLIDQDEAAQKEMKEIAKGFQGVPFIVVEKDGKRETVIGFDKGKIDSLLQIPQGQA